MNSLKVFLPHLLFLAGFVLWTALAWHITHRLFLTTLSWILYITLFLLGVALIPDSWLTASPTTDQSADTAIILGFGYEMNGEQMLPGIANQALLDWTLLHQPQAGILFVQEGVFVAADPSKLSKLGIEIKRIHRHDPALYINTLDTAFCAIQQMQALEKNKALLVAHDLQLQRTVWDFERVAQQTCPDCTFLVADIHGIPYPQYSVHMQTRNSYIYKIVELLISRPRDFLSPLPTLCKAQLTNN